MRRDAFARIVGVVTRRPLLVLAITALLAVGGAVLALRLEPSAATETLVDRGSDSFQATERFKQDFGDEAVLILVRGKLTNAVLTDDLGRLLSLEGCLGGNIAPEDLRRELARHRRDPRRGLPAVCGEIAELKPAKVVFGPATFINTSANEIIEEYGRRNQANERQARRAATSAGRLSRRRGDPRSEQRRLAEAAYNAVRAQFVQETFALGLRYGITGIPRIDDPSFVSRLVFGTNTDTPKSRFAYLFPSSNAAMVTVRLRPGLSEEERRRAIDLIRSATGERMFQPRRGGEYIVSGVPVVAEALAEAVQDAIFVLLGAALLVMAATLALVFRSRLRLLPLLLALAASALTFGALYLAGGDLTMASIAVLPVLIGLAVDYAIQFQARFDEEAARGTRIGAQPAESGADGWGPEAATAAAAAGGPTILTAGIATAVGFLVLLLSPVPMVRSFGALLVVGIGLALLCALLAGFAALARFRGAGALPRRAGPAALAGAAASGRIGGSRLAGGDLTMASIA
ncbi:MAG TPA: MMPL family transporter, partial [Thermoleophilaceae bacterium]|nr:MMPL family transporter [Thermoleophilaceae bacterium]